MHFRHIATLALATVGVMFTLPSSASETFSAQIEDGSVMVTPARCFEDPCSTVEVALTGTFEAAITGAEIQFSNIVVANDNVGFSLPSEPNSSVNGTVNSATFEFDGDVLSVSGMVDQRAFDGPLYSYYFEASVTDTLSNQFDQKHYYLATQDLRKCVSPLCGGIFIQKVNRRAMRCPDGEVQKSCYIGEFDWRKLGSNPFGVVGSFDEAILLKGKPTKSLDTQFGNVGRFEAEAAFQHFGSDASKGKYAGLQNNGILCITSPCFSFDMLKLNSNKTRKLSGIDYSQLDADKNIVEQVQQNMANGETVIAFGTKNRVKGFAGKGLEFVVKSVYLPIIAKIPTEPEECLIGACDAPPKPIFPLP